MGNLKTVSRLKFIYTSQILSPQEMLNRAHRVRTIGGENYINHQNGLFVSTNGLDKLTLDQIYKLATAAFTTDRRCIARRRNPHSPLIKGFMRQK